MNETTLLEFQLAEMLDAAKYVLCGLGLAVGNTWFENPAEKQITYYEIGSSPANPVTL